MAKLNTYIVSGHAMGSWSVNIDATSPEDAKAQVEELIDDTDDLPVEVESYNDISVGYVQCVGPAVGPAKDNNQEQAR